MGVDPVCGTLLLLKAAGLMPGFCVSGICLEVYPNAAPLRVHRTVAVAIGASNVVLAVLCSVVELWLV
jgi:hypothetical protein